MWPGIDDRGRRYVMGTTSVDDALALFGDGCRADTLVLRAPAGARQGLGGEPLEWAVAGLGDHHRLVTCVLVDFNSVTVAGAVHPRHVPPSQVLSKQRLRRHTGPHVLAPRLVPYPARPLYLLPLGPAPAAPPEELVTHRIHALALGRASLCAALDGAASDEERAVRAAQWHEAEFANWTHADDDTSQAVLAAVLPGLPAPLAARVRTAEQWVRLVRTYILAPSDADLLRLLMPAVTRTPSRKPRRRGTGKAHPATFTVTATGEPSLTPTIFPCRQTRPAPVAPLFDPDTIARVPGWPQLRASVVGLPSHSCVEFSLRFERVPELLRRRLVRPRGGVATVPACHLWAVRHERPVEFTRPQAARVARVVRNLRPAPSSAPAAPLDLPPIDDVCSVLPPCMVSILAKMEGGRLTHNERFAVVPLLHNLGYPAADIRGFFAERYGPTWDTSGAQADIDGLAAEAAAARAAGKRVRVRGCRSIGAPHCPFVDIEDLEPAAACYQRLCGRPGEVYGPRGYVVLKTRRG